MSRGSCIALRGVSAISPLLIVLVLWLSSAALAQNAAPEAKKNETIQSYTIQGSTTFTHRVMEPYQSAIEAASGHKLTVVMTKSSRGVLALFEKQGDFAMISGPLETEIAELKKTYPDLPYGRLKTFDVVNTRMAFAVNADNPVHQVTDDTMRRILFGEIANWHEIGGPDLPIQVVMVQEGGGVQASIESELLHGKKIAVKNPIMVQLSIQVVRTAETSPGALGLSQLGIVRNSHAVELKIEHPVEQHLALVTLGDPTPDMRKVIDAARDIMRKEAKE